MPEISIVIGNSSNSDKRSSKSSSKSASTSNDRARRRVTEAGKYEEYISPLISNGRALNNEVLVISSKEKSEKAI